LCVSKFVSRKRKYVGHILPRKVKAGTVFFHYLKKRKYVVAAARSLLPLYDHDANELNKLTTTRLITLLDSKNTIQPTYYLLNPDVFCTRSSSVDVEAGTSVPLSKKMSYEFRKEGKVFEVEMQVQYDDLDPYGVVKNEIYASYIHNGHFSLCSGFRELSS
jgi:hypothetical protein